MKEARLWLTKRKADLDLQEQTFIKASSMRRIQFAMSMIVILFMLASATGIAGWLYLMQPPDPTRVTTLQDNVNGSLRYCIKNALSGSTITFAQGMRGIIKLTGGDLVVESGKQLTIVGPGANLLTISGGTSNANIHVPQEATLKLSGLSFKNNKTIVNPFLFNEGTLTVTNSTISDNKTNAGGGTTSFGGGIFNSSTGTLTVVNSILSNNSASGDKNGQGGGIFNEGKLTVTNSTFSHNSASGKQISYGGGIINYPTGTVVVTSSTFSNNSASSDQDSQGGGIANFESGTVVVTSSTFSNNSASSDQGGQGGGIVTAGKLTMANSTFSHNSASGKQIGLGGSILNFRTGTLVVTNSTFSANSASGDEGSLGGGIDTEGKLSVTNSTFVYNTASGGGGISFIGVNKDSSAIVRFSTLYGNTSSIGGGIWVDPTGSSAMRISSNIVAANSAHDAPNISGALISAGYNLSDNFAGAKGLNATTDKQVTLSDLKIDPTLRNNGGPTQTLALLAGSLAIDAVPGQACSITVMDVSGQTMTITTDQRGVSRLHRLKNACDSGAFSIIV